MNRTNIEYLDLSWNPIAMRCTPVSPGCANCWHLKMATRLAGNTSFSDDIRAAYAGAGPPVLVKKRLDEPVRRKKPAIIGVQFMGDLFHDKIPTMSIRDVWTIFALTRHHTCVVLTKRPKRAFEFISQAIDFYGEIFDHVWFGITAENQKTWIERRDDFFATPAAVHFISYEPALAPLVLSDNDLQLLDWVICGAETGPGKRPMDLNWAISLRDQCIEADVPFFFKKDSLGNRTLEGVLWEEFPRWKVICNAANRCGIKCPHSVKHEPYNINSKPCTDKSPCATYALLRKGVGWKKSECQCIPAEENNDSP